MFDKHRDEPTAEVDAGLVAEWRAAKATKAAWEIEEKRLRQLLEKQLGDAHAGTVDGEKVLTNRPIKTYRVQALLADNPDLAAHYFVPGPDVFQVERFARMHPEIAERYRSRAFKDAQ